YGRTWPKVCRRVVRGLSSLFRLDNVPPRTRGHEDRVGITHRLIGGDFYLLQSDFEPPQRTLYEDREPGTVRVTHHGRFVRIHGVDHSPPGADGDVAELSRRRDQMRVHPARAAPQLLHRQPVLEDPDGCGREGEVTVQ